MTNDEKDLEFLREIHKIVDRVLSNSIPEGFEIEPYHQLRFLLAIAVNALAGKDENRFKLEHHEGQDSDTWWACLVCDDGINDPIFDPRHAWTESDWQKAKWKEVKGK